MEKTYLDTPEAIIKALKEGKEVRDGDGYSYKLVEGLITKTDGYNFYVGDNISSIHNPYILEEKSFEIKVGEWYETRNHHKARCYFANDFSCFFTIDNYSSSFCTNKHGYFMEKKSYIVEEKPHNLDIIGLWKEDENDTKS